MSTPSKYVFPDHKPWELDWIVSALRGLRNAIVCGARIRTPYVMQTAIYVLLYRDRSSVRRLQFVLKQLVAHGRNLGLFVLIYKLICSFLRHFGMRTGLESWIAGFIGGYYGFGDSSGVRGAVNKQVVLYLFARGLHGLMLSAVNRGLLSPSADVTKPMGFRVLAGFSLALILYLTEHEPETLQPSFMRTMTNLYHESDSPPNLPETNYIPLVLFTFTTLFVGTFYPPLSMENLLSKLIDRF
mmetsp:Transcript_8063/g.24989  ORF Transcript_8063/g.24989 Transcript_8063/m.24989 type:complete len:242 (-) Transcript_8063:179-904(-)